MEAKRRVEEVAMDRNMVVGIGVMTTVIYYFVCACD